MAELSIAGPRDFGFDPTVRSHGWYDLPPFQLIDSTLHSAVAIGGRAHDIAIAPAKRSLRIRTSAPKAALSQIRGIVAGMFQLDEDLSPFYRLAADDRRLAYAPRIGAGRMLRAPTAFEDLIKMLLTTNCSWSLTRLMVTRLTKSLGATAPSGRRAFPTAEAMAKKNERFYRDTIRAGYRSPHLCVIARAVASGKIDPEGFRRERDTERLREQLLELPGIGPYAADNLLRLCGSYGHLGLDSWCRGKLKQLYPKIRDPDRFAARNYQRYGDYRGLALWLDLTADWHEKDRRTS